MPAFRRTPHAADFGVVDLIIADHAIAGAIRVLRFAGDGNDLFYASSKWHHANMHRKRFNMLSRRNITKSRCRPLRQASPGIMLTAIGR